MPSWAAPCCPLHCGVARPLGLSIWAGTLRNSRLQQKSYSCREIPLPLAVPTRRLSARGRAVWAAGLLRDQPGDAEGGRGGQAADDHGAEAAAEGPDAGEPPLSVAEHEQGRQRQHDGNPEPAEHGVAEHVG